ncbi:MAG: type II secretion system F family protein [archaeon]
MNKNKRMELFGINFSIAMLVALIAANLIAIIILIILNLDIKLVFAITFCFDLLLVFLILSINQYSKSLIKKSLEDSILEEILKLTSLSKASDIKLIIQKLKNSKNKYLSKEFKEISSKIEKGHNIKELFEILKSKYNSEILDSFLDLLISSRTSGTVRLEDYKRLSDNFIKNKNLIDERNSILLIQKYTIILAGALLVPAILGIVISLSKQLGSVSVISTLGFDINSNLFIIAYYCTIIYIIEYVIISSVYLAFLESNIKKTIIYLIILLPISLIIFLVAGLL